MLGLSVLAFVLGVATLYLHRQASTLATGTRDSELLARAQRMLDALGDDLRYARGDTSQAWSTAAVGAGDAVLDVDLVRAFPPEGTLLLQPGTAGEERIDYAGVDVGARRFLTLGRGARCSVPGDHPAGTAVLWAAAGTAIDQQAAPPPELWDGVSQELTGPVFYRGDGSGFAYRIPVDPAGGEDYFDAAGDVQWGAVVEGLATLDGRAAVEFRPVATVQEAARGADLNGDGDLADAFDLGQLVQRAWDGVAGGAGTTVALCPPIVLQEACRWGGDLDGDGFDDPIFLWEPSSTRLRIRLFLLDAGRDGAPLVRRVEVSHFLRNGLED